ncbi:MAG: CDF family Co(II)/Ni(II) efflux transporter DmeF [Terrimicrobiaceae bacterium]
MNHPTCPYSDALGANLRPEGERRTLTVLVITAVMMVVEIAAGLSFGSMALLADGMHMGSHAVALGINVFAYIYARRHAKNPRYSFGTGKVNALGGFSGAILLALFALAMAWESLDRLLHPTEIAFNWAIGVAFVGLLVNGLSVLILGHHDHRDGHDHKHEHHHGHDHDHSEHHGEDHNLRSAYLHVLADALTSITAIIALVCAKFLGWVWMDPVMGIAGSILVAHWSLGLLRKTSGLLLDEQAPEPVIFNVREALTCRGGDLIDLHVWSVGPGRYSVAATVRAAISANELRSRLDPAVIVHATIEVHLPDQGPACGMVGT